MLESKRFQKLDSGFVCINCGAEILPLGVSSRNHCPYCLCSLHVDINPGDRANSCHGVLRPISAQTDGKKGYLIIQRCDRCGEIRRNRAFPDVKQQPDNIDLIIRLTAQPVPSKPR